MTRRPLTRAERAARTRRLLMAAASKVCARRGLERASIDEVAEEAGFTKGAFYANFRSKDELFLAMLDERFATHLSKLDARVAEEGELSDQARDAAVEFAHELSDDPEWMRLYFQFAARAARDEGFRAELVTRTRAVQGRLAEIFARRTEGFEHKPTVAPDQLALIADVVIDGFTVHKLLDPERFPDELHGQIWEIVIAGLAALAVQRDESGVTA
jgi:AcrR family transcriptional regulator